MSSTFFTIHIMFYFNFLRGTLLSSHVCFYVLKVFFKKIEFFIFFSLLQINIFLCFQIILIY